MHKLWLLLAVGLALTLYPQGLQVKYQKAVEKEIRKTFNVQGHILEPIEIEEVGNVFHKITTPSGDLIGYSHTGRVNTCRAGGCSGETTSTSGMFEYFDYLILFDTLATVRNVKILSYQSSYGHEITGRKWLGQFRGYKGDIILTPGKNIDAISGATFSVFAITDGLVKATQKLQDLLIDNTEKGQFTSNHHY